MINASCTGRLGRDAEIKESRNGGKFLTFPLATDGISKDDTIWLDVVSSTENVLKLSQWLTKGRMLTVFGDVRAEIYTDRNGASQIAYRFHAYRVEFISSASSAKTNVNEATVATTSTVTTNTANPSPAAPAPAPAPQKVTVPESTNNFGPEVDELPF